MARMHNQGIINLLPFPIHLRYGKWRRGLDDFTCIAQCCGVTDSVQ